MPDRRPRLKRQPDALLLLGDLERSIPDVLSLFPGVPAFGVAGNHDAERPFEGLPVVDLHGRAVSWGGITLAGLGGCLSYKPRDSGWLFSEGDYAELLARMPRADILLSHCAPYGCWREPPRGGGQVGLRD